MIWSTFLSTRRGPVPSAFVAAVALGLSAGITRAQMPAAKPGTAASAQPAAVPAEPGMTTATFGDWVLRCQRAGEGEKTERLCEVAQAMQVQVQGQAAPIAQVAIGRVGREPLRVTAVLPVAVSFPSTVQIQTGVEPAIAKGPPPLDLAWRRCLQSGCFADAAPTEDVIKRWRNTSEPGRILFKDAAGREATISLSLRGLPQALDALAKEIR